MEPCPAPEEGFENILQESFGTLWVQDQNLGARNHPLSGHADKDNKRKIVNRFDELGNAQMILKNPKHAALPTKAKRKLRRLVQFAARAVSA